MTNTFDFGGGLVPTQSTYALSDLEMEDLIARVKNINSEHDVSLKTIRQKYIKIKDILVNDVDTFPDVVEEDTYKLIEGANVYSLTEQINVFLRAGWKIHGSPIYEGNGYFAQAITREVTANTEAVIKE